MLNNSHVQWQPKKFQVGDRIVGDHNTIWLINQGIVKTSTWDEEGRILVLGYWVLGDVVGQPLSRIKPYTIECLTPVEVAGVPCQYWSYLSHAICSHHQDTEKLLYIFRQKTVYQKVIEFLLFLAHKIGAEHKQGKLINIPLTHQELADAIGTTRVNITKIINSLEQKNLINRPERGYIILRQNLLAKFN